MPQVEKRAGKLHARGFDGASASNALLPIGGLLLFLIP
jgi:hypothetical protein